jgi:hypothetical protein
MFRSALLNADAETRWIRAAVAAGTCATLVTALFCIFRIGGLGTGPLFLDVPLVGSFTWGIHQRSRIASGLMFVNHVAGRMLLDDTSAPFVPFAVVVGIVYFMAFAATVSYHARLKAAVN